MRRRSLLLGSGSALAASMLCRPARAERLEFDRFSVVVTGEGPDVIFVPGLSCSRDVWSGAVASLGDGHRVHLLQIAGFAGEPAEGNAQGDVAAGVAEGLAGYIADRKLTAPAIVGHSMGGTISLMLAARHPGALGKAMVVDMIPAPASAMIGPSATPEQIKATADRAGDGIAHADDAEYRQTIQTIIDGMILTAGARPAIVDQGMASDRAVAGRSMHEIIMTDLRPELPRITAPVTVLYAWNKAEPFDAAQSDQFMQAQYAGLKGVKLVRIDDSAHFIFLDQPARFAAELAGFLRT